MKVKMNHLREFMSAKVLYTTARNDDSPEEEEANGVSELSLVGVARLDLRPGGDDEGVAVGYRTFSIALLLELGRPLTRARKRHKTRRRCERKGESAEVSSEVAIL